MVLETLILGSLNIYYKVPVKQATPGSVPVVSLPGLQKSITGLNSDLLKVSQWQLSPGILYWPFGHPCIQYAIDSHQMFSTL